MIPPEFWRICFSWCWPRLAGPSSSSSIEDDCLIIY